MCDEEDSEDEYGYGEANGEVLICGDCLILIYDNYEGKNSRHNLGKNWTIYLKCANIYNETAAMDVLKKQLCT